MSQFSRRQFLHAAGITLLGSTLDPKSFFNRPSSAEAPAYGRTLYPTTVYGAPAIGSPAVRQLWPESIHPIRSYNQGWYLLNSGYVPREAIQPMTLYPVEAPVTDFPCWLEVASPVAVVRKWCAPDAPLVTRIGHGGVAQVVDVLEFDNQHWYAIQSTDHSLLGWTQTTHWQRALINQRYGGIVQVEVDQQKQRLQMYENGVQLLTAPFSSGRELPQGIFALKGRIPAGIAYDVPSQPRALAGAPWQLQIADIGLLSGVYWHNAFGVPVPGPEIQTSTLVARWLYQYVPDNALVSIF
ncbi:MAG: L,D-transpeptidase [Anaerolineae bacterium]|nr:L,D-transpeptidase [Anaerolineae bacterium]